MASSTRNQNKAALAQAMADARAQAGSPEAEDMNGPDPDEQALDARLTLLEELLLRKGVIQEQDVQQLMAQAQQGQMPQGPPPGAPMGGPAGPSGPMMQ